MSEILGRPRSLPVSTLRGWLWRARRKALKLAKHRFVRTRYGVMMQANWSDATFNMCFSASYGHILSDLLQGFPSDFVFLDIGSNQGLYALLAARNPMCRHVYAFEPVTGTFAILQANIRANGFQNRITALNAAISDSDGTAEIFLSEGHSGAASMREAGSSAGKASAWIKTMSVTGIDALQVNASHIVIKIDVEGHEPTVLAQLMASRHREKIAFIFYEVDEAWSNPGVLEDTVRQNGLLHLTRFGTGTHYDILASREPFSPPQRP